MKTHILLLASFIVLLSNSAFTIFTENILQQEIVEEKGKKGMRSETGQIILPIEFDEIIEDGDLLKVEKSGKWGYFSNQGKSITGLDFDSTYSFDGNLGIVFVKGKMGLINKEGKKVLPTIYDNIDVDDKNEIISIKSDGKLGFCDLFGNIKSESIYEELNFVSPRYASVKIGKGWGVINSKNEISVPLDYELVNIIEPNYALAIVKKKYIYMCFQLDKKKKLEYDFDSNPELQEGRLLVKKNGLYGYLDENGEEVISPKFSKAENFTNGIATVTLEGKVIKINQLGLKI